MCDGSFRCLDFTLWDRKILLIHRPLNAFGDTVFYIAAASLIQYFSAFGFQYVFRFVETNQVEVAFAFAYKFAAAFIQDIIEVGIDRATPARSRT